ncbi:hypothetical protein FB566_4375 [Stackebrandtia endophytica]|uniref:Uncharacterized protein n=1 Tax=Stackebrandtia endophytica TaxID=1496996 RepID=A0A543B1T0_9ACTN|nr:hypothetical protein [Stackebrandtia endophytica]TQL78781.1 hypothetical protein FB566_4375 [Stackebrandtia endophytica]
MVKVRHGVSPILSIGLNPPKRQRIGSTTDSQTLDQPLQLVVEVELVALPLQLVAPQLQLDVPQQLDVEQLDHAGWSVSSWAVS